MSSCSFAMDRAVRNLFGAAVVAGVFISAAAAAAGTPSRVVVAWTDQTNQGHLRSFPAAAPWEFDAPALNVGAGATLRYAGGLLYVVSRTDATVAVVDPADWTVLQTHSVGADREPVDIAIIAPDLAYVSCVDETHLLRFNPITGTILPVVDLSVFADADGIPDLSMMTMHEGRLFIQIQRQDSTNFGFVAPAMIAVVDLATEQLIDVDPKAPGIQALELQGTAPKFKMQIVESTRRLFVSASGEFFDAGGIEMIDLDTLATLGLVVHEEDDMVGADLGAFVLVTPERGYLTFSTDLTLSSHMVEFTVSGGVFSSGALFETVGYFVPTLPHDAPSDTMYFPDGGSFPSAVHALSAADGSHLATVTLGANMLPTDVLVIPPATSGPAVPASSTWGMLILALLVTVAADLIQRRATRARSSLAR